jgi:AraC-like DNA-binding protein
MRIEHVRPCGELAFAVDRFWSWESAPGEAVQLPTLLPGTGAELFFHYRAPFEHASPQGVFSALPSAHLLCVRNAPLVLRQAGPVGFFAVRLRAGLLHRFARVPACELADRAWPVGEMWGAAGARLAEQVAGAANTAGRVRAVERFLLGRLALGQADLLIEHAVGTLYRAPVPVALLAQSAGLGVRQFERRCKAVTGQAPAEVRRNARLQKALRALMLDPALAPLDAALAHGYFDQSHFIRDFRALAGMPPGRFIAAARTAAHFYNPPSG